MAPWEYEFAPSFINGGHFHVTDPGRLHAPVLEFSIRRDEHLELIVETRTPSDAKSAAIERPSGTVRITTECVELENAGGSKAKLSGVVPFSKRTYDNYETGESKLVEKPVSMSLRSQSRRRPRPLIPSSGWKTCRKVLLFGRPS
jgi:hypothetical protein